MWFTMWSSISLIIHIVHSKACLSACVLVFSIFLFILRKFFFLFCLFNQILLLNPTPKPTTNNVREEKKGETIILLNPQLKQMRKDLNKIPWYYWHIKANKNEWKKYERIGFRIKTFSSDKPNFMKIEKHFVLVFMGYWYCVNIFGIPHKCDQPHTILTLCFILIPNSLI